MQRQRLDTVLVERKLAESRERAQRLIRAGRVRVDGNTADKPGRLVCDGRLVEVTAAERFVGRGGEKLEHAFEVFGLEVGGIVCLDVGASTGGFTDCMLQHGARKVYAVDAGRGQLHWRLRTNHRVVVMERTNARHLGAEGFTDRPGFAAVDVSFISLTKILQPVMNVISPEGTIISLIKPQFEASRAEVGSGGVVRDPETRARVADRIRAFGTGLGLRWLGICESPVKGPAGNIEFLAHWRKG